MSILNIHNASDITIQAMIYFENIEEYKKLRIQPKMMQGVQISENIHRPSIIVEIISRTVATHATLTAINQKMTLRYPLVSSLLN